ncbi:MAG: Dabb family protein [Acutalibacteraceae bacterium]|jgi:hypothetical protein
MVKHVILWTLKPEYSHDEKERIKARIKNSLEGLYGKIPGLLEMKVNIHPLPGSNADLMLDSTFESEDALRIYATHPAHIAVANAMVRPYTATRHCMDFLAE